MEYRELGRSGLQVSAIGFGCMSLGTDDAVNDALFAYALSQGINFFDTADIYQQGENERRVGRLLKSKRNQAIIATKGGNQPKPDGKGWDWNPGKAYLIRAVEDSLKRLQTSYIDLYQLHGGTSENAKEEIIGAFELLKTQGKILHYGISSIRPKVIREYLPLGNFSSVMMQYSLLDQRPEEHCLEWIQRHKAGVLVRGSIAKGLLAGKAPVPFLNYTGEQVKEAANTVQAVSGFARSAVHTAIRFVLHHPAVTSAVVGISSLSQLKEVVETTRSPELTGEELGILRLSVPVNYYDQYR